MATRSRIGIERWDGSVQSIYCHYDGHPSTVGTILAEHYPSAEAAEELLELGDLSELGEGLGSCVAYHRDRGEGWSRNRPVLHASFEAYAESLEALAVRYIYLYRRDSGWVYAERGDGRWRSLSRANPAISKEE